MSAVTAKPLPTAVDYAAAFADLVRLFQAAPTPQATLKVVCRAAVFMLPSAERASVTVIEGERFVTAECSDSAIRAFNELQYKQRQGPCLDAITDLDVVVCDDVSIDDRWPALQGRTETAGDVRSVLSLRLFLQHDTVGSLTLYSTTPGVFTAQAQAIGSVFAVHAAIAIQAAHDRERAADLQAAFDNNRERTAGRLLAHETITTDAGIPRLHRTGQTPNRTLRDIADDVASTGQIPTVAPENGKPTVDPVGVGRRAVVPHSSIRLGQSWLRL